MNFIEQLNQARSRFSKNEVKIYEAIINNLSLVINHNNQALALKVGTSTAAISRFIQKTGFESYSDFRMKCIQYHSSGWDLSNSSNSNEIFMLTEAYQTLLGFLPEYISEENIKDLATLIHDHKNIKVYGGLFSSLPAQFLKYKFFSYGKYITFIPEDEISHHVGGFINDDDLVIFFSASMKSYAMQNFIAEACATKAKLAVITMISEENIEFKVDHHSRLPGSQSIQTLRPSIDDSVIQMVYVSILSSYYEYHYSSEIMNEK